MIFRFLAGHILPSPNNEVFNPDHVIPQVPNNTIFCFVQAYQRLLNQLIFWGWQGYLHVLTCHLKLFPIPSTLQRFLISKLKPDFSKRNKKKFRNEKRAGI
jgi:hypothetical protein